MGKNAVPRVHVGIYIPAPIPVDHSSKSIVQAPTASNENERNEHDRQDEDASGPTIPISRKAKRKLKKSPRATTLSTPPTSETEPPAKRTPPNNSPRHTALSILPSMSAKNAAQKAYPLLICSIGNPGSTYAHTLHSAGHTITSHIASVKSYKPFTKGLSGLVARPDHTTYSFNPLHGFRRTEGEPEEGGDDWTFWQSTSLMNVSGKSLAKAWREFSHQRGEARLVVIHDELESALGKVSVRDGASSAKGHNGIKSAQASLGGAKWWRVGVGIGRPESREPDVVARYVLRKMNAGEMRAMEKACGSVVAVLREIAEGKR